MRSRIFGNMAVIPQKQREKISAGGGRIGRELRQILWSAPKPAAEAPGNHVIREGQPGIGRGSADRRILRGCEAHGEASCAPIGRQLARQLRPGAGMGLWHDEHCITWCRRRQRGPRVWPPRGRSRESLGEAIAEGGSRQRESEGGGEQERGPSLEPSPGRDCGWNKWQSA